MRDAPINREINMKSSLAAIAIIIQIIFTSGDAVAGDTLSATLTEAAQLYVKGDYTQAFTIWKPLAEKGDIIAQVNVGMMWAKGQVVPNDYAQAYMWFTLAANNGSTYGAEYRDIISKHMSQTEISSAQTMVDMWRPK